MIHHVAIIPDGNRRWAKEKGLPTFEGHKKGFSRAIEIGKRARKLGIPIMTLWGFSTDNWKRSNEEVSYLMQLYEAMIERYLTDAHKEEVRIIHLGRKDRIPQSLRKKIEHAEDETRQYTKYYLCIGIDYGGRDEVMRAIKKCQMSNVKCQDEKQFHTYLDTRDVPYPDVDLVIRTSGEKRLSGFLIWQAAYAELMFVDAYFPDFSGDQFESYIHAFKKRVRRFGV